MGGGSAAKEHPWEYFTASALAASINYPLWRASAIGQSGFSVPSADIVSNSGRDIGGDSSRGANHSHSHSNKRSSTSGTYHRAISSTINRRSILSRVPPSMSPYVYAFAPPYKGMVGVVAGMTWARAAIFYGSDAGRDYLNLHHGEFCNDSMALVLPPLIVSTLVQCINMPIVRASITLQNPQSELPNTAASIRHIYHQHGLSGLWHGTSAGILKTVPKYCTAVIVKDSMEGILPPADPMSPSYESDRLWRSAAKSAVAGIAGAALTNPLDVIRNEMFKQNTPLLETVQLLYRSVGYSFLTRGLGKNLVAVSVPVGCTIFFTDALIQMSTKTSTA